MTETIYKGRKIKPPEPCEGCKWWCSNPEEVEEGNFCNNPYIPEEICLEPHRKQFLGNFNTELKQPQKEEEERRTTSLPRATRRK